MGNRIGTSRYTRMILGWFSTERELALDSFCSDCAKREYTKFDSLDHAYTHIEFLKLLYKDWQSLKHFSGFNYFDLNRAAKGTWNYEDNGSAERLDEYKKYVDDVCLAIKNNQSSIGNVRVYRGVPIKYFRGYGINSVDELTALEGEYLINFWNLAQVTGVRQDGDDRAIVQAMLVPKKVYAEMYAMEAGNVK